MNYKLHLYRMMSLPLQNKVSEKIRKRQLLKMIKHPLLNRMFRIVVFNKQDRPLRRYNQGHCIKIISLLAMVTMWIMDHL